MTRAQYVPMLRPAGYATLPSGIDWEYVATGTHYTANHRPDVPVGKTLYGVILTSRFLTPGELERFSLRPADAGDFEERTP